MEDVGMITNAIAATFVCGLVLGAIIEFFGTDK